MRLSTIREYSEELKEHYRYLQENYPEELESLGATDDLEAFQWEMTMQGVMASKKYPRRVLKSNEGVVCVE
jgi:hypothetical protein